MIRGRVHVSPQRRSERLSNGPCLRGRKTGLGIRGHWSALPLRACTFAEAGVAGESQPFRRGVCWRWCVLGNRHRCVYFTGARVIA